MRFRFRGLRLFRLMSVPVLLRIDVTVARLHNKSRLIDANLYLTTLPSLSGLFRVIAQTVLATQLFRYLRERFRDILQAVATIKSAARDLSKVVQVGTRAAIIFG